MPQQAPKQNEGKAPSKPSQRAKSIDESYEQIPVATKEKIEEMHRSIKHQYELKGIAEKVIETKEVVVVEMSPMSDGELKLLLKETFEKLARLPRKEIERIAATVDKKAEKWGEDMLTQAPELYADKPDYEHLIRFLERVYVSRDLLTGKLTTAHFDVLDAPCGAAIRAFIKNNGSLPDHINIPLKYKQKSKAPTMTRGQKKALENKI